MREKVVIKNDWKFILGDQEGAAGTDYDDSAWRSVIIPHDWGVEGPYDPNLASATGFLPGGIGWYRKTFEVSSNETRRISLQFDGVYCNSQVWLNGSLAVQRPSGFASFEADITDLVHRGEPNVLAVRVDHEKFADSRWYTGSGINRNVHLLLTDAIHIERFGVFARVRSATAGSAKIDIDATVANDSSATEPVTIEFKLYNDAGQLVASSQTSVDVHSNAIAVAKSALVVETPRLWSTESPYLYRLHTAITSQDHTVDTVDTPIGIRTFRFDPNEGFFLNDAPLKLKGVCLHDDAGCLGTAVPASVWKRRLITLKDAGVNAVRMSHNQHMPELYDLCDRLGLLVQDEAFDEWELGKNKWIAGWNAGSPGKDGYSEHFSEWAITDLRDLVLQNRNHPSIVMWSIGNEIDYPNDPYSHPILDCGENPQSFGRGYKTDHPHSDRLGEVAMRLVQIVKEYDDSRPVTAALSAALISNETGFADALDIVGYNYQETIYGEDHEKYPNRVVYGSENGMAFKFWNAVASNSYVSGQFLWTGIDYLGEAGQWPYRGSGAGLLDLAGFPKPEYYYRKSLWSSNPMVYIGTSDVPIGDQEAGFWTQHSAAPVWAGAAGVPIRIVAFTNSQEVELALNGRSLGTRCLPAGGDRIACWDTIYEPGTLIANAMKHGEVIASAELKSSGPASALRASIDRDLIAADGDDTAHVLVEVIDASGNIVYDSGAAVNWEITGPARLIGLESGDLASHEDGKASSRKCHHGLLLGYVQSTEVVGDVTVTVSSPSLGQATISFRVE